MNEDPKVCLETPSRVSGPKGKVTDILEHLWQQGQQEKHVVWQVRPLSSFSNDAQNDLKAACKH